MEHDSQVTQQLLFYKKCLTQIRKKHEELELIVEEQQASDWLINNELTCQDYLIYSQKIVQLQVMLQIVQNKNITVNKSGLLVGIEEPPALQFHVNAIKYKQFLQDSEQEDEPGYDPKFDHDLDCNTKYYAFKLTYLWGHNNPTILIMNKIDLFEQKISNVFEKNQKRKMEAVKEEFVQDQKDYAEDKYNMKNETRCRKFMKALKHVKYYTKKLSVPKLPFDQEPTCAVCYDDYKVSQYKDEQPQSNIFTGPCGHCICQSCKKEINKCPICKGQY